LPATVPLDVLSAEEYKVAVGEFNESFNPFVFASLCLWGRQIKLWRFTALLMRQLLRLDDDLSAVDRFASVVWPREFKKSVFKPFLDSSLRATGLVRTKDWKVWPAPRIWQELILR